MTTKSVEIAKNLSTAPLTKENTQRFLNYLDTHFPDGWEKNNILRTVVLDFQLKLSKNNEKWAQDAYLAIDKSKNDRWALASSLGPNQRPLNWENTSSADSQTDIINNSSIYWRSLSIIWVDEQDAFDLAKKALVEIPNTESITQFQHKSWIDVDGMIGKETYWEMLALILRRKVVNESKNNEIRPWTQKEIRVLLWYANIQGEYIEDLLIATNSVLEWIKEYEANFVWMYWDFHTLVKLKLKEATKKVTEVVVVRVYSELSEVVDNKVVAREKLKKAIWNPLTPANIKAYRKKQGLTVNEKIDAELYMEVEAVDILAAVNDRIGSLGISQKTQARILQALKYWNPNGVNVMILRAFVVSQHETLKKRDDYESNYRDFYKKIHAFEKTANALPESKVISREVETELHKKGKDGRSMYRRIKDGIDNGNIWDELMSLLEDKWPMALFILAGAFIFGMIPWVNDTVATNTWWKRLLVWGVLLANGGSITDMAKDLVKWGENVVKYIRSPEAQAHFDSGQEWIGDVWKKLPDIEKYWTSVDDVKKMFHSTIWKMEWVNEAFKKTDIAKYIEWFTGKSSVILSDEGFLNTPKSIIMTISNLEDLKAIMTQEKYKKLTETHKMSDSDVQVFISEHMSSRLKDSLETDIVRKTLFWSEIVQNTKEAFLDTAKNFNHNPVVNSVIRDELSNIINGNGSETYKQAGIDLWIAIQKWRLDTFSMQSYKSLPKLEREALDSLVKRLQATQEVQRYISDQINAVNAIEVKTQGLADTPITLEQDFTKLEALNDAFVLDAWLIGHSKIKADDYETWTFKATYVAKRKEILEYAWKAKNQGWLGLTTIWKVNDIKAELGKAEKAQEAIELGEDINSQITSIEPLPWKDATPLEMRSWWDDNQSKFSTLEELRKKVDPANTQLLWEIDNTLKRKNTFIERYKEVREEVVKKLQDSQKEIDAIKTGTPVNAIELKAKKENLDTIRQKIEETMNSIIPWSTISGLFKSVGNLISWKDSPELSENAIDDLDKKLKTHWFTPTTNFNFVGIGQIFSEKIVDIESDLDVNVDISALDVSNWPSIAQVVSRLQWLEKTIDMFDSEDVKNTKSEELAKVYAEIAKKYVTAIKKASSINELNVLKRSYDNNIAGEFGNTIEVSWKALWNGFIKHDEVTVAYEEKSKSLKRIEEERKKEKDFLTLEDNRAEYLKTLTITTDIFASAELIVDISNSEAWEKAIKEKFDVTIDKIASYSEDVKPKVVNGKKIQTLTSSWIGDNFPMTYQDFKELLQMWSTNPELSEFHNDINSTISWLNEEADKNILK